MQIVPYTGKQQKQYTAVFTDSTCTHFGQAGGSTYIRDKGKRAAYVAHQVKIGVLLRLLELLADICCGESLH